MSNLGFRKVKLSIRWILFFTLFAMSIIPILIITTYSQTDLTKNLEGITLNYQNSILKQINTNIDFIYEQYLMTLTNIFEKQEVIEGIDLEKFRDSAEEREVSRKIIGQYYKYRGGLGIEGGIREIAEKKIYGDIFIYEQDKASIIDKTPYKYYTPNPDIIPPNYEKLIADPLFQKIKSDNNIKIIIGKPREGVLTNYFQKDSTIIIFPFYYSDFYDNNRSSETFSDFILVILRKNFFEITFENITNFNQGTLYMLDINNNIIMQTHPSDNNYYEYDYEQKKYISTEKEKSEEQYDKVDFSDYKYLNTDSNIINDPKIQELIEKNSDVYTEKNRVVVKYNNLKYIVVFKTSEISKIKLLYFIPYKKAMGVAANIIEFIGITALIFINIVMVITLLLSTALTRPIFVLFHASNEIAKGKFDVQIDVKSFFSEFYILGIAFNKMTRMINRYKKHTDSIVEQRTEELNISNRKLLDINNRMENELVIAKKIQEAIIPQNFPSNKNFKIYSYYYAMEKLGGDFYDVIEISKTKIAVVMLDVSGHGIPPSLVTTMTKFMFSTYVKEGMEPQEVVNRVNKQIYDSVGYLGYYMTLFYGVIDTKEKSLEYISGAHCDTYIVNKDKIETIKSTSTVVGLRLDDVFKSHKIEIKSKDTIVLFTDGIVEAKNSNRELYGYDRVKRILQTTKDSKNIIPNLMEDINYFKVDITVRDDDMAVLVIEVV